MGAGRSGSTILGVALGNCDDVFYAGELDKWLAKSGVSPLPGDEREAFWAKVLARVRDPEPLFGGRVTSLERSSALFRPSSRRLRAGLRAGYRRVSGELMRAVADVAGAGTIVDSSHYPQRAAELQSVEGIELHLILLVRDPLSVVASFNRDDVPEKRFGELTTNAYLWLTYVLAMRVFLRHPSERRMMLRHEDLLADPHAVLAQVLTRVGAPVSEPDLSRLRTGLPFQGNRLVRTDVVALEPRAARAQSGSLATRVLQLPLQSAISRMRPAVTLDRPGAPRS